MLPAGFLRNMGAIKNCCYVTRKKPGIWWFYDGNIWNIMISMKTDDDRFEKRKHECKLWFRCVLHDWIWQRNSQSKPWIEGILVGNHSHLSQWIPRKHSVSSPTALGSQRVPADHWNGYLRPTRNQVGAWKYAIPKLDASKIPVKSTFFDTHSYLFSGFNPKCLMSTLD